MVILQRVLLQDNDHQWEYIYPVVCVNTAEEFFYKTRSTSRSISTLLYTVVILQRSSSTRQGAPVGVYLPCCVCTAEELFYKTRSTIYAVVMDCRGALLQDKEHQCEYIYPVVCVSTAVELFYTTRSTSGSTPRCVLVIAEVLFYKTRSTSRSISTLLCVLILQRSPSTRQGAPVGYTYHVVCVNTVEELFYKTRCTSRSISTLLYVVILRGALLHDKEYQ